MEKIFNKQWEALTAQLRSWLTPGNLEGLAVDVALSLATLAATFLLVKLLSRLLDRVIKESGQDGEKSRSIVSDNFIRSVRVLLKTLLLYGGYFIAAVIILEIFNVHIISPEDLKSLGIKVLKVIGILVGAKLAVNFGHMAIRQVFAHQEI